MTKVEPSPAGRPWALGNVQHPLIGAKRLMKPNRMVEARNDQLFGQEAVPVPIERAFEQAVVAGVGEHGLMHHGIVAERAISPKPSTLNAFVDLWRQEVDMVDLSSLDRPVERQQEIDCRVTRLLLVGA